MNRKDLGETVAAICVGAAVISFAGVGVYLAKPTVMQDQKHERELIGRTGVWTVVRRFDPIGDRSGECFITAGVPWTPTSFMSEGQAFAFAPELGIPITTAVLSLNLTKGEMRVSPPAEALGPQSVRRQVSATHLDFRIDGSQVSEVVFHMDDPSTAEFRRVPFERNGMERLIQEMATGHRFYAQWSTDLRSRAMLSGNEEQWSATYFLPLDGFRRALSLARAGCEQPRFATLKTDQSEKSEFAKPIYHDIRGASGPLQTPAPKVRGDEPSAKVEDQTAEIRGGATAATPEAGGGDAGPDKSLSGDPTLGEFRGCLFKCN